VVLRIVPVTEETAPAWREIHNAVIPTSPLSLDDVTERLARNRLTLAYVGDDLIGNATIRPPRPGSATATVIVRVLEPFRRRGQGSEYLAAMLDVTREMGARRIETVVLAATTEGLSFARRRGFVESERYSVDGAEFVDLALTEDQERGLRSRMRQRS
jgi:GNAT superfamily N-acetyltransferase